MSAIAIKRALISVSDKRDLIPFAEGLTSLGVEIISTGGTAQTLSDAGIPHLQVESITQLPEMLGGRVKTLHPKIHGGILAKRDQHQAEIEKYAIPAIDLVVVNFYPFDKVIQKPDLTWEEAIENIDIGGPTMVRAAAKNHAYVSVITQPEDYALVLDELKRDLKVSLDTRRLLAQKAFALTAKYDAIINQYFLDQSATSANLTIALEKHDDLRYGENPHLAASAFRNQGERTGIFAAIQHQGKPLSYNNYLDADAALNCVAEFEQPSCVIVKHTNPCGVATAETIEEAYKRAHAADPVSAFGGIIALNRECTAEIAELVTQIFMEVIVAPSFSEGALNIFAKKPNLRVLALPIAFSSQLELRYIRGGALMQAADNIPLTATDLTCVTIQKPTATEIEEMLFAWRVIKHVKSNAILLTKDFQTIGIGVGQVSRIDAVQLALKKASLASQGSVLASDAFFPFRDSIDQLAQSKIKAIIQPGGSIKDNEVIAACDEYGIAMVFTGKRAFKH